MTAFNPRKVAIAHVRKLLSDLITESNVYINGQVIFAIDALGRTGIKVGDWNFETDDISAGTPFIDLPWIVAPESAGTSGFTPFKINTTSASYAIDGDDAVITDLRLVGAEDPVVFCTKTNTEFRDEDLVIDAVAGTLRILNFYEMDAADHISIIAPSRITTADSVESLIPRIEDLEKYTAPFSLGGGVIIWRKPANQIPAGWQEVEDMRGKTVVGCDVTDGDYNPQWTKTGGTKTHTIASTDNLPKFKLFTVVNEGFSGPQFPSETARMIDGNRAMIVNWGKPDSGGKESYYLYGSTTDGAPPTLSPTSPVGKTDPDEITHLNPYRIVMFIEPTP